MRLIKGVLFVLAGLFIFVTLISLLIPSKIYVARAVAVQGDSLRIFNEISDLRNWKHWHPVFMRDSSSVHFTNDKRPAAEWTTGNKINRLIITEKKYPYVKLALQREGENDIANILSLQPVTEQGNMQVQWQSVTYLKWYPWEKFGGIFTEKMTGPGYDIALEGLKKYLQNNQ